MSKNHPQQYWNEYTTFMCHTILHLLPYHLHKAFFCSQLKGLLLSQIAPHFSPPFLLPLPKEQVSHFLIQLFTALVTRNLFLPLGGRVGRFLVVFFCGCVFFPGFIKKDILIKSDTIRWCGADVWQQPHDSQVSTASTLWTGEDVKSSDEISQPMVT